MADRPKRAGWELVKIESEAVPRRSVRAQTFWHQGRRLVHVEVCCKPQSPAYIQLTPEEAERLAWALHEWATRAGGEVGPISEIREDDDPPGPAQGDVFGG